MPALTNVHARHRDSRLHSLRQASALPFMVMLRKSLPGRSVFGENVSPCAEAGPDIPQTATTNVDAMIRRRRHIAASLGYNDYYTLRNCPRPGVTDPVRSPKRAGAPRGRRTERVAPKDGPVRRKRGGRPSPHTVRGFLESALSCLD